MHTGFDPDPVDDLAAIAGAPDRAGGLGQDLAGARRIGEQAEAAHGGDRLFDCGGREGAVTTHDVAQPQHLLLLHEGVDVPVGVHIGHQEMERVRSQVHGRDAHCAHAKPRMHEPATARPELRYGGWMPDPALASPARFRAMGTDVEVLAVGASDDAMTHARSPGG